MNFSLGTGSLTWNGHERRSDRYGSVALYPDNVSSISCEVPTPSLVYVSGRVLETYGELWARVVRTRKSTHIGDLFHNIFPSTPNVDEMILLGEGFLFVEVAEWGGGHMVGVRPKEKRTRFWLDPRALYRCHEQTVELIFEQKPEPRVGPESPFKGDKFPGGAVGMMIVGHDVQGKQ